MKKLIAMLLAMMMVLSLVACGNNEGTKTEAQTQETAEATTAAPVTEASTTEAPTTEEPTTEAPKDTEYAIGEAFGTDNVECVIKEIRWVTSEEFISMSKVSVISGNRMYLLKKDILFPDCTVSGTTGCSESKISENSFIFITCTLQNIGKNDIRCGSKSDGGIGMIDIPYGQINLIYDDGYTFGEYEYSGFTDTLKVLGDPIKQVTIISFPNQVLEKEDKPVKLKVKLPNSNGETEEFIVSIR